MLITLVDVSTPQVTKTAKGQYQAIEVSYKNEQGQIQGKKLMSFSNPTVFKAIQEFAKGDILNVEATKDDQGYWQWKAVQKSDGTEPVKTSAPAGSGGRVTGSNYETPEERAKRQVYIVRQSSISSAIDLLKSNGNDVKVDNVLAVAKQLEAFVFGNESSDTPS
jgi:hypothetical protein